MIDHRPSVLSQPLPLNVDTANPFNDLWTQLTDIAPLQYRNSRTGNARRAVSQPDHDVFEGLPVRRWRKKSVNVNAAVLEKPDPNAPILLQNGYRELPMPKDSNMLTEACQAILRAARMGLAKKDRTNETEEGRGNGKEESAQTEEKPGLLTRKWALLPKEFDGDEPEYLAKRRKGLPSLYGGDPAPVNTTMRKTKIRKTDSEGNSQVFEVLVPEGQTIPGEIVEDELISPTQAPAPGTVVEGVGVANAEGVVVAGDPITAPPQRKRPPPPKRRFKGPGRGRKKKVQFAAGKDSSILSSGPQVAGSDASKPSEGEAGNGAQNTEGDNEDSIMQDTGQDGEEGSEEGSEGEEGEEGEREDGEVSETPEASSDPSKAQVPVKEEFQVQPAVETKATTPPPPSTTREKTFDEVMAEQQDDAAETLYNEVPSVPKEEAALDQMDESVDGPSVETAADTPKEPASTGDMDSTMGNDAPDSESLATSALIPLSKTEALEEPAEPSAPPTEVMEVSEIPDPASQDSVQALEEQPVPAPATQKSSEHAHLPPKPPPSLNPESIPVQEPVGPSLSVIPEQTQDAYTEASTGPLPAEPALSSLPGTEAQASSLPPPPPNIPETIVEPEVMISTEPLLASKAPSPPPPRAVESILNPTPPATAPAPQKEQMPYPAPAPIESRPTPIDHHTPKAPTPSPPTPIAASFDQHQRERLMESPRAPTMSPPTPAQDRSSSPDLPLASHNDPPPLDLDPTAGAPSAGTIPGLGQQLPPREDRIDVEAARDAPENFAAEIPHEHDPLDGLAPPKVPDVQQKEGEEHARFSDGEEDLLGSLERSLGN